MASEPIAVSVEEAAHLIGLSRGAVYPLVMSGAIPSAKVGARRVVPVESLKRWLQAQAGE